MLVYDLFLKYCELGVNRSLDAVAEASGRSHCLCEAMARRFDWPRRARAWDEHLYQIQERAIERQVAQEGIERAKKRIEYSDKEFILAEKLIAKAEKILDWPLEEVTDTKHEIIGDEIVQTAVTYKPMRFKVSDAVSMIDLATKLSRLNLHMVTSRDSVNVNISDPKVRLEKARAALLKLQQPEEVEKLVQRILDGDPSQERSNVMAQLMKELPEWVSTDWDVPLDALQAEIDDTAFGSESIN